MFTTKTEMGYGLMTDLGLTLASPYKFLGIYIPVDTSCYSRHIYLRLSARISHEVYRGPRKSADFWGEEKWRQAKLAYEFHLASPFRRRSGGNILRSTQYAIGRIVKRFIKIS